MASRERGLCPWGCEREVALSQGNWPMPHKRSLFGTEPCVPPLEWAVPPNPRQEPVAPALEPEPEPWLSSCGDTDCGHTRRKGSKPPRAWLGITRQGDWGKTRWFCSSVCLTDWLADPDAKPQPRPQTAASGLAALNGLAGVHLTIMTATPERVRRALDAAFARLVEEVDDTARWDARDRPTTVALLAELGEAPEQPSEESA